MYGVNVRTAVNGEACGVLAALGDAHFVRADLAASYEFFLALSSPSNAPWL